MAIAIDFQKGKIDFSIQAGIAFGLEVKLIKLPTHLRVGIAEF